MTCCRIGEKPLFITVNVTASQITVNSTDSRRDWSREQQIDGLVQERRNPIVNALELRVSCTNPSKWASELRNTFIIDGLRTSKMERVSKQWRHHVYTNDRPLNTGAYIYIMMTSSNGNIFRVTGPLWGESTGHRWIPFTKASDTELWCFLLICAWTNGWANNQDAGYLRRHRGHYDVTAMLNTKLVPACWCMQISGFINRYLKWLSMLLIDSYQYRNELNPYRTKLFFFKLVEICFLVKICYDA